MTRINAMKKIITLFILLFISATAWAVNPFNGVHVYVFPDTEGGTDQDLDSVDGNQLEGNEIALIFKNSTFSTYILNAASSSPTGSFAPDSNPGTKKWEPYGSTGNGNYSFTNSHTSWADGLSSEEIWRTDLQTGEVLVPTRLEIIKKGGGTDADFSVDVYDDTTDEVLWATYDFATGTPDPSGAGDQVILRITNGTGGAVEGCINFSYDIQ
jgi:hypothetical protein